MTYLEKQNKEILRLRYSDARSSCSDMLAYDPGALVRFAVVVSLS